ncbi:helix-turn-helix domain-containing protein [Emticicia sp. CRIBPO]|uniref:AraC family transcriptional regulator n=1 Tax=Emticicia sp. CRIBPO TaxID=2683258 RepID=UPI001412AF42|nr:helix-turn-helix domain-containing protein [Emticicia sp. CRIBPO]NBA84407.1 helix-turn-helix domain-containing protein [Emticicia sp. CRIBPO]
MIPYLFIYLFAAGSAFLLAFVIFINADHANRRANRWFSLFLVSTGFALTGYFIWHEEEIPKNTMLLPLSEITRFTLAPALYLSVWHFTHPQKMKRGLVVWHILPAILFFIFSLPSFFTGFESFDSLAGRRFIPETLSRPLGHVMTYIIPLQFFMYWIASFLLLKNHRGQILLFTSDTRKINLKWLNGLLWIITAMMLLWFNQIFFKSNLLSHYAVYGYLSIIFLLTYFLLTQKEVFSLAETDKEAIREVLETPQPAIPNKPRLGKEEVTPLKAALDRLLTGEKVYTEEGIDLPQLARYMNIPVNDLSYVINEGYGMNFFSLINSHRVEEAKRLMLSPAHQHLSVLGIAYEAGFSSKTTFNDAFKKHTGQTPSEFIKSTKKP